MLVIRIALSSVIFAFALIFKLPPAVETLMLIAAAGVSGYDIVLSSIDFVENGDLFSTPMTVTVVAFLAFVIGFGIEGAALVILYQIGMILIDFVEDKSKKSALELLKYEPKETVNAFSEKVHDEQSTCMNIEQTMGFNSGSILRLAMLIAVVYAIVMPLVSNMTFQVSIHRCLMIILVSTPMSVVIAMPSVASFGLCRSAQLGLSYNTAADMERSANAKTVVIDKSGVFDGGSPTLEEISSEYVDRETLLDFAAHALFYSEQPIAKTISAAYHKEYQLELISDFTDYPGYGVELKIKGLPVVFGTKELFIRKGSRLKFSDDPVKAYYMMIADKMAGKFVVSSDFNSDFRQIIPALKENGLKRCILITEEGKDSTSEFADMMEFDEAYSGFDSEKKLAFIDHIKSGEEKVIFIYAAPLNCHTGADVDITLGDSVSNADCRARKEYFANIAEALKVSGRTKEIATQNSVIAFLFKVLIIFLSITGFCNLWFAIFIDIAVALGTILNASRVCKDSFADAILYKFGK